MIWQTIVVGNFGIVGDISEEEDNRLIHELEAVLEADIGWDDINMEYRFGEVNWTSYISSEEIVEVLKRNSHLIQYFNCWIYHHPRADEEIIMRSSGGRLEVKRKE